MSDACCRSEGLRREGHDGRQPVAGGLALADAALPESARARVSLWQPTRVSRVGEGMADAACAV
jgi:hypothetical protein